VNHVMLFAVAWLVRDEHVTRDGKLCDAREGTRSERGAESQEVRISHDGFMTSSPLFSWHFTPNKRTQSFREVIKRQIKSIELSTNS
jgi:hypothetical protein